VLLCLHNHDLRVLQSRLDNVTPKYQLQLTLLLLHQHFVAALARITVALGAAAM